MFEFKFNIRQLDLALIQLAEELKTTVTDGELIFPGDPATGYIRHFLLPNDLDTIIIDLSLTDGMWINRQKTDLEYYVFICEEIISDHTYAKIDGVKPEPSTGLAANVYLVSFLSDLRQYASAGSTVRGIRVILSPEWLASYLHVSELEEVLQRYLALKSKSVHVREMDYETHRLLEELLRPPVEGPLRNAYLENRIMMILEIFFSWLSQQMSVLSMTVKMTKDDIARIIQVEKALLSDLSRAPSITDLSKLIAVSASKLKKQFRDMYGLPPYEYFQQQRMQKAKEMLMVDQLTVKQVGNSLGYSNLSNFTLAFRKVFNENPGEMKKKSIK